MIRCPDRMVCDVEQMSLMGRTVKSEGSVSGHFLKRKNTKTPIFVAKITKTPLLNRHFIFLTTNDNLYK